MYAQPNHPNFLQRASYLWRLYTRQRGLVFSLIIVGALLAFELFNYSTTDFALTDLLGEVRFLGVRWGMILALAFCAMDFAGVARLFTPEADQRNKTEVWYLLAAWLLAAGMNALLTWWGISLALLQHATLGNEILSRDQLLDVVPVFVAVLVLLIRILLIGTFAMAGERVFTQVNTQVTQAARMPQPTPKVSAQPARAAQEMRAAPPPPSNFEDDFDQRPRPVVEPRRVEPAIVTRPILNPQPIRPNVMRPAPKPMPKVMPQTNGSPHED